LVKAQTAQEVLEALAVVAVQAERRVELVKIIKPVMADPTAAVLVTTAPETQVAAELSALSGVRDEHFLQPTRATFNHAVHMDVPSIYCVTNI
jgi:hypothetical protein